MSRLPFLESFENFAKHSSYFVEANDNEIHYLWKDYSGKEHTLEMHSAGYMKQVGTIEKLPINIQISLGIYREHYIFFWHACSMAVHYGTIDEYLTKLRPDIYEKKNKTDTKNFHNCIHHIDRLLRPNSVDFIKEEYNERSSI